MLKLLSHRKPPPAVPAGHRSLDRSDKSRADNRGGGRRRRRHKKGGHRSLWLKLRRGDLSTIQHPSRLHEQVQVHLRPQLVKVDKFLLTLGTWVGGNDVCHVRLEDGAADLLFCLRFDARYRVRVVPFVGQVLINDEPVNSPGAVLEVGDVLECGPYTFQMVPKPSASDRRGPLARPGESTVLEDGTTEASLPPGEALTIEPPPELAVAPQPEVQNKQRAQQSARQSPTKSGSQPESPAATDVPESEPVGIHAADVQSPEGDDGDFDEPDFDDIEATDSSISLSLSTASRLRSRDSDGEFPISNSGTDSAVGDEDEMSSSRSAWRRPRFATAGQTIEPFIVTVPAASRDALPEQFAMVNQSISRYVEGQEFAAVVLDFHQIQDWSPVLTGELIQLCEAVESCGGLCAASRLSIDFLQQFQNSGLPECFTLYPTTERAVASLT